MASLLSWCAFAVMLKIFLFAVGVVSLDVRSIVCMVPMPSGIKMAMKNSDPMAFMFMVPLMATQGS